MCIKMAARPIHYRGSPRITLFFVMAIIKTTQPSPAAYLVEQNILRIDVLQRILCMDVRRHHRVIAMLVICRQPCLCLQLFYQALALS